MEGVQGRSVTSLVQMKMCSPKLLCGLLVAVVILHFILLLLYQDIDEFLKC